MAVGLMASPGLQTKMIQNFFTGKKDGLEQTEIQELVGIMRSATVQKEYCDYLIHTSRYTL